MYKNFRQHGAIFDCHGIELEAEKFDNRSGMFILRISGK